LQCAVTSRLLNLPGFASARPRAGREARDAALEDNDLIRRFEERLAARKERLTLK
jgi:hypothetical protein